MIKKIFCFYSKKIENGYNFQIYPGKIGKKILNNISIKSWKKWIKFQTIYINKNNLNMSNSKHINKIEKKMLNFLFFKK
ncbi:oxidative damage protection protein [Enterobacterales bacterium endosymbiont of Anomoneura mori]|uniref:oxidative damage protection protein n=1 Tax=Enterobacterales bacterium endosymbiont of Anomoneura mori TaxID=3132096 RepID=UPI00399CA3EC